MAAPKAKGRARAAGRHLLPGLNRTKSRRLLGRWLRALRLLEPIRALRFRVNRTLRPAPDSVFRLLPVSNQLGFDRGTPLDRYYIEAFLTAFRTDIQGRVLEIQDSRYTRQFGAEVERSEVLDIDRDNPKATIVADLADADAVATNSFDCIILTQTLFLIYHSKRALRQLRRMLAPGGVLLATNPGISPMVEKQDDYWRFTPDSCSALFEEVFGQSWEMRSYGNLATATAFLTGVAWEELPENVLNAKDDRFPVILGVRAVKDALG